MIVVLQLRFFFKVLSFQITWRAGGAGGVMNEIILNILKGHEGMSYYFLHVYICLKFSRIKVINDKMLYMIKIRIVVTFMGGEGVEMVMGQNEGFLVLVKFHFFI